MIRILIVDDHTVVRRGLALILENDGKKKVVASYANASDALNWLHGNDCDVAIVDIAMPDMTGIDLLMYLRKEKPKLPVLILSAYPEAQYAVRLIKAGAAGYLNKECAPEEIESAVHSVLSGKRYVSPAVVEMLANEVSLPTGKLPHEALSNREYQIFLLIASSNPTAKIAEKLKLSVKTIGTYRSRILEKMQMHNNTELVRYAVDNHLLQ
jgi:DNA-binding NarL/FixJ family response regulator